MQICYPKATSKPLYQALVTQCRSLRLRFVDAEQACTEGGLAQYDVVVDALFGFSFRPPVRAPFDTILAALARVSTSARCFVASVDIPSGWHVEQGDSGGTGVRPDMLISLTAPKRAAKHFEVSLAIARPRRLRRVGWQERISLARDERGPSAAELQILIRSPPTPRPAAGGGRSYRGRVARVALDPVCR